MSATGLLPGDDFGSGREATLVLRPNQSLSWREAKLLFGGILAVSLTIAFGFTLLGFWPVLPFAGAELALLGWAMYTCQVSGRRVEVISILERSVAVEKGTDCPSERWDFERAWVRVELLRPRVAGHPTRLQLRAHGREVFIGDFLGEEERRKVAGELRAALMGNEARGRDASDTR